MAFTVITPPAGYPVTIIEMNDWLRESLSTSQYDVMMSNIAGAVDLFEGLSGRKLIEQTIEQTLVHGFDDQIDLECAPAASVISIKYDDSDGSEQTLLASEYKFDNRGNNVARIVPAAGKTWPDTYAGAINTVRVQFVSGYGGASAVPSDIKEWIKSYAADLYNNRGQYDSSSAINHPYFKYILAKYRVY